MSSFTNVEVVTAGNIYFDGKATGRVIKFADCTVKTLVIMMPGDCEFGTAQHERTDGNSSE